MISNRRAPARSIHNGLYQRLVAALIAICTMLTIPQHVAAETPQNLGSEWSELFNGKDLNSWTAKITGQPMGKDARNTFRVEDGLIKIRYDQYDTFDNQFGHLFFASPFERYQLLIEYRFIGEQLAGGPGWAERNSGVMLHAQAPATMTLMQDFPNSIEVQFLGGFNNGEMRPTANLCTPGTDVTFAGKQLPYHCQPSKSATFDGDQWVQIIVNVDGGATIQHEIQQEIVLAYEQPTLTDSRVNGAPQALTSGYLALQSESHPIDFRRVAIRALPAESALKSNTPRAGE
ncbi:MAG TPA: DUF1080 domain-containing protein [Gammaproteobacteria bacterium]|nr:DUF1080 domain-containing protein [Gammaproteobacteria bacterium]